MNEVCVDRPIEKVGAASYAPRLVILHSQLRLLRMRAERGIPVSVESLARAEQLAAEIAEVST